MALKVSRGLLKTVAHPLIIAWASTWRVETVGAHRWEATVSPPGSPTVFLFWHEVLLPLLWHHRKRNISTIVSHSRDGEYVSDLAKTLGYSVIRGSSSKGATRVLLAAVSELRDGRSVAFSPDGPRGPTPLSSQCTPPPIGPGGSTPGTGLSSLSLLRALVYFTANHLPSRRGSKPSPRPPPRPP